MEHAEDLIKKKKRW